MTRYLLVLYALGLIVAILVGETRAESSTTRDPSAVNYYESYIPDYGVYGAWLEDDFAVVAPYVEECESRWNPAAVNPSSGATGLFQLLPDSSMLKTVTEAGYVWADMKQPKPNTEVAHLWWQKTGRNWGPWYSSYACWAWQVGW